MPTFPTTIGAFASSVTGIRSDSSISGATDYHRLDRVLVAVCGKHLHEFARVLDWGVGCGRVARHFPSAHSRSLTGCDIDRDNVEWCSAHLAGSFVASRLTPPLPFDDGCFDLVYGISVFTHFREAMQLALARRARTGDRAGCVPAVDDTRPDGDRLLPPVARDEYRRVQDEVKRAGILVSGTNSQLDGHAEHEGEYVNVYHSADYVRSTWGRFFDVEHIVPGYILHHDLVVLRKA